MAGEQAYGTEPDEYPFGMEPDDGKHRTRRRVFDGIPSGMDEMEPGPVLAALLSSVDATRISGHDQIVVLRAQDKMASHYAAARYASMTALHETMSDDDGSLPPEDIAASAAGEIRTALRLTRRSAETELAFALDLNRRLPRLAHMLATGQIDVRRARAIERGTTHLTDAHAHAVVDAIAADAPSLTTGQIRAKIRKLCIDIDPDDAQERYDRSIADRRIITEATDGGTANLLGFDLPPDTVAAISGFIHDIALTLNTSDETRTMDQLRADVYLDLLQGRYPASSHTAGNSRAVIELVCDLETLTGLTNHPGDLAGYGPVIADIARRIARDNTDAEWRYTCINDAGTPTHTGTTSRRPTESQKRRIRTRHRTCVFPGCRMPARVCDIDHTTAVGDGGETCDCNLAPLCRRDHRLKHMPGWDYAVDADGIITWTTPSGHTYTATVRRAPP